MRLWTFCRSTVILAALSFPAIGQETGSSDADDEASSEAFLLEASTDSQSDYYNVSTANAVLPSFGGGCDCPPTNKQVAGAHKGVFYANDFSYLNDPNYCGWHLGDNLKRINVGNCWVVDAGGQYRMRYHSEHNFRNTAVVPNNLGLTGASDDFLLHRTRLYLNAEYGSHFRFYGEMLDAVSNYESFAPRPIEENRTEMQNMFAEVKGIHVGRGTVGARIGRQEVLLGAQRLVSPLDWANTRRTFDGARVAWQGDSWDIDGMWLRPMKRNAAHRTKLDAPNLNRQLYGVYANYKGLCRDNLEAYWLALDYEDVGPSGIRYDTIGARYWGADGNWLYELEGGVQFGENADTTDHSAGFVTAGLGRKFPCAKFKPTVWMWYDWASGDDTVGNGFHHYEPLAHKYNGFMDLFGRRNLHDVNVQAIATLTEKTKFLLWYHYFALSNGNDVPYNVTMTPFNGQAAGTSGSKDLGHEIDFVLTQTLTPRSSILFGYSHFFAGNYFGRTAGVPFDGDADFFYTQWHVNF
jgi:hypothetical protein